MAGKLTELLHCMWRKEDIPQEFKDASIIHLYKRKEILKSVTTTDASPSYLSSGRYCQNFCGIAQMFILITVSN